MAERKLFEAGENRQDVPDAVLDEAIHWVMLMQSGTAGDRDREACRRWRAQHADHELAWQRLAGLCGDVQRGAAGASAPLARRVLASGARVTGRRKAVKLMLGTAGVGVLSWSAFRHMDLGVTTLMADYSTGVGGRERITLPDGSQLVLNTDSAVAIDFTAQQRILQLLRGELLLETARDGQGRPMLVQAGDMEIRPLGTRFAVRRFSAAQVRVAVREGAVELRHARLPGRQLVQAGEQGAGDTAGWVAKRPLEDICDSWETGMLVVERMPLGEFVDELGRYRRGVLRCDPAVAALQISGAFPLADTDAVLAAVTAILPVAVHRVTPYWVTLAPA
ncbi:FecR domain-containing protein [Kerstersia similis]|uniref:FecR domain-containing protein n=1 Tax=Kerstersia similis TaxID=206505 RepID=UPI0039EF9DA0